MTAPAPPPPITAEEFLHLQEQEGAELADGRIVELPMGSMSGWLDAFFAAAEPEA